MAISLAEVRGQGRGIKNRQVSSLAGILPYKLDKLHRYAADDFKGGEVVGCKIGGLAATTTDGDKLTFKTAKGLDFDKLNIDTQATNPLPVQNASGLDLSSPSQTSAKGCEYVLGGITNPTMAFVTGTDAFFIRIKVTPHDAGGQDFWVGFRKLIAFPANAVAYGSAPPVGTYLDFATLFLDGTAGQAAGATKTQTTVGGAAAVTTDLSVATADDTAILLEVRVDQGGNVTYLVNGATNSNAVVYQFTAGLTVVPFMTFINTADVGDGLFISQLECGLQAANVRAG